MFQITVAIVCDNCKSIMRAVSKQTFSTDSQKWDLDTTIVHAYLEKLEWSYNGTLLLCPDCATMQPTPPHRQEQHEPAAAL